MKNKKNSKIWLILSSISTLTAIFPLVAISCDYKVKQNSKENKEDLKPDENKPEPKPENPTKEDDSSNLNKTFKFELTKSNTWKIAKYIGNDSEVIIPKEYQGKNITEIGNGAFSNSIIQSVTIPSSIKKIGDYAFEYSQNLKDVVLNEGLEEIGQYAFFGSSLTSVVIPNSTKKIGGAAFDYWNPFINIKNANFEIRHNFLIDKRDRKILAYLDRNATKVVIPTWIKKIGDVAFNRCENIKEVILNDGLEEIGTLAFHWSKLASITIPSSVKEIGEGALPTWNISSILINSNNKNFEIKDNFFIDKNNKKILAYMDKKTTKVTIPNNVKKIGDSAFSGCENLKEVILNEGLEKIGDWAFSNTNIESITIPWSVKEIGEDAFLGCRNLKEVILNEGLEKIGYEAFRDTNIDSITIPSSVKEIEEGALSNSNISSILINSNNKNFEIKDNFFINKNNKKILAYLDKKTTKVTIPNNVKEIGEGAFSGCENLKEVILNEGLEKIGAEAFQNLLIELVYIPSSVKEIGYSSFSNCKNLKEVILNEGLKKIGDSAFCDTNIESITIPDSVKEIGERAFFNCKYLKEVILNEGLEKIGAEAFDFSIISYISINSNNKNFEIKDNFFIDKNNKKILAYLDKKVTKVTIPSSTKEIGKGAFSSCANLKEVVLNEGLERIGDSAFSNTNIESITIPSSTKEIGEDAFLGCRNLKEVILNEGLEKIGAEAFSNTNIESITIPSSTKEIGKGAFSSCANLKEVILNEGLEKIGSEAFNHTNIESITIPGSIKEISESAFFGCANLKEVILNEGLEKIGTGAFLITNIKSITIPGSVKEIGAEAFDFSIISYISINSNNKNFEIKDNFFIDKNNKKILAYLDKKVTKVTIPDSVKEIGKGAFSNCKNLNEVILNEGLEKISAKAFEYTNIKSITISSSVKEIGESAFSNCKNLKEVILNEGLEKIGYEAFQDTNIEYVTIPSSVKEIGYSSFYGCQNLKEVILNEGLEKIGAGAFLNTNIESITIPDSVKKIGESAFFGCKNLKEVIYKGDASNINWKNIGIDKTKIKIISSNN